MGRTTELRKESRPHNSSLAKWLGTVLNLITVLRLKLCAKLNIDTSNSATSPSCKTLPASFDHMTHTFVRLPSGDVEINHIRETVNDIKDSEWKFLKWFPRPALINRKSGTATHLYTGQSFDPDYFELDNNGWTHDHCQICFKSIGDKPNEFTEIDGYYNGYDWVCKSCFKDLLKADDLELKLATLYTYVK